MEREREHGHLPRRDGRSERDTCAAGRWAAKNRPPAWGRAVSCSWYHPTSPFRGTGVRPLPARRGRNRAMQWLDNGSRLVPQEPRHRLLTPGEGALGVRLRGLVVLAIPIPLHSNRGSLHRSRQGPVPVNAVAGTLPRAVNTVKWKTSNVRTATAPSSDSGLRNRRSSRASRSRASGAFEPRRGVSWGSPE